MSKNNKSSILFPKKFVNLHAHSHFSVSDALGTPQEHIDFALRNGMDSLALTDHGNMNGFSHQYIHAQDLKKKGVPFKALYGIEAYFIPDLLTWQTLYDASREKISLERLEKKKKDIQEKTSSLVGDAKITEYDLIEGKVSSEIDEELQGDSGVEDEAATKSNKWKNPLFQRSHLVLLAKNSEGLKSLFSCVSHSFMHGFYKYPRMDFRLLEQHAKGNIIATSACVGGMPSKIIFDNQIEQDWEKYAPNDDNKEIIQTQLAEMVSRFQQAIGPENFYLEIQWNKLGAQHLANYHIIECAKRTGVKLVSTADSHYSDPSHWKEREIYRHMAMLQFLKDKEVQLPESVEEMKAELYPKNAEQIWDSYQKVKVGHDFYDDDVVRESIERTYEIAHSQIDNFEINRSVKFPSIKKIVSKSHLEKIINKIGENAAEASDEDYIAFQELKTLAIAGARFRKIDDKDNYIERLKHELEVVRHLKFSRYFLTYAKIMEIVGSQCLTGPGRGSAAGSLLAYALNITQIDPIKNDLLFVRFLTKNKSGFPDIDSDISDRDKGLKLLANFFGEENVIPVSNFNQLQMRSLIKDLSRINGVSFEESNAATKKIEAETKLAARKEPGFDATQWFLTFEASERDSPTFRDLLQKYPDFEKMIKVLFKSNRNLSRHAGGVIITSDAKDNMPVVKSGGVLQTPWTEGLKFRHLEYFGFLKYDILGLGTLRMFESCIKRILKNKHGIKYPKFDQVKQFYYDNLHPDNNDMTDMKVYKHVYWNKRYAGIFQFVNPQVQSMMAKMKPRCVNDIAILTSLFRPGPLSISADKKFLKNRKSPEEIEYKHPLLKEVLHETSGIIIFQEQLQLIYHKLAGVPLEETDDIRKAFTKKDASNKEKAEKERLRLREEFVEKCYLANQIDPDVSAEIFDEMEQYVKYSFNKSHACSYATLSYQSAWFLTYHPDEWVATYVDYCTDDKGKAAGYDDPKAVALSEAKNLGYGIGKPDINLSERDFVAANGKLVPSFSSIKSVGVAAQTEIFQNRPYRNLQDLLWNHNDTWRHSKLNKRALGALIKLEALDSMGLVGKDKMFGNYKQLYHVVVENGDLLKKSISRKNQNHKEVLHDLIQESKQLSDWEMAEKINFSKELAGSVDFGMVVTPEIMSFFKENGIEAISNWKGQKNLYWAIVESCKIAATRTGRKYCRVKLCDDSGNSFMCFMWNYNEFKDKALDSYSVIIGNFKKSDFGLSVNFGQFNTL
jgi:DNA polymerase-3 subunit alpha